MSDHRPEGVSRFKHFRAWLSRQARGRRKDTLAIIVLALAGIVMLLGIFIQQKASLPSWIPFVGETYEHITAEFSTAQAVTPGQGQAVDVAGVQIGKVTSVDLEDGHAVIGMDIQPKYMELIHPNASFLLRPKTGLNDMIVEVEPGTGTEHVKSGHEFTLSQTEPNENLDQFLASLDSDTRQYIQLLVAGGAQGIGGAGQSLRLSNALRRFQPFVHYVSKLNSAVAARHVALARVIHDFGLLTDELSQHEAQIRQFVSSSDSALGNFANQQSSIQDALERFPGALRAANEGFASSNRFSQVAFPSLTKLIPQTQALTPAFKASTKLFKETTAPIREGVRPFTREIRPLLTASAEASSPFEKTVRNFGHSLGSLNSWFNELTYKPKGPTPSYLFYVPWANHDFNAAFNLQDAGGPAVRGLVEITCTGAQLGYGLGQELLLQKKTYLKTLLQIINLPRAEEIPVTSFKTAKGHCEYVER
ncbi:MAG TPA: MlaD family protein [Solirubrobacterales bacterium]|jgi:phospholipid/cholesterol/gamma-HCH transport system substrate-binding protein